MKRSSAFLLPLAALLLAGASTPLRAQDRPERPRFSRNPVALLVDSAQMLGLSSDQTTRLRAIAEDLEGRNKAPLDSLERNRPQGGGGMGMGMGGGEMTPEQRERMEHLRPFMQAVRDNNRQAMDQAMELLTPEQRERVQAMMPRRGPGGPPPQP
jgi:hypothetical protein